MNGQIVLCKGINDGEELERSIKDLSKYLPYLQSVSVVPAGLTKYREGLYPLEPFQKEEAIKVIDTIEKWQKKFYEEYDLHFIHASDEWYILADREVPEEERYDGYLQLDNGVGMLRLLQNEFEEEYQNLEGDDRTREVSIVTGGLAYPYLLSMAERIEEIYPNVKVHVYKIRNDFFGELITVSGLITGQDLLAQLKEKELGEAILIPCNMLRDGEEVFLDDITLSDVKASLQVEVNVVKSSGQALINAILND